MHSFISAFIFSVFWLYCASDWNKSSCWFSHILPCSAWVFLGNFDQELQWYGRLLSSCSLKVAIQMSSTEWKTDFHSFIIKSFLMQPCSFCGPRCEKQLVGWACVGGQLCLAHTHTRGNCNEKVHVLREHAVSTGWCHTLPHRATRWASAFQRNEYINVTVPQTPLHVLVQGWCKQQRRPTGEPRMAFHA